MTTLKELTGIKTPRRTTKEEIDRVKLVLGLDSYIPVVDGSSLIGIEVEVENIEDAPSLSSVWARTEDGSLRNNGVEYVSAPIQMKWAEVALRGLFHYLPEERSFSKRTSVHIHLNVLSMTKEQLNSLLMLYMVFETSLFKFVGENREKNIHCVPIHDTIYFQFYCDVLDRPLHDLTWHKYSALNLLPVISGEKGTVEFRHLNGTDDVEKIMAWINLIGCLKVAACKKPFTEYVQEISMLNTNSQYRQFAHFVFSDYSHLLVCPEFEADLEAGVSLVKLAVHSNRYKYNLKAEYTAWQLERMRERAGKKPVKDSYVPHMEQVLNSTFISTTTQPFVGPVEFIPFQTHTSDHD